MANRPDHIELFDRQYGYLDEKHPIECDSPSCPDAGVPHEFYKARYPCSGCSRAKYCSPQCRDIAWATHAAACTASSSVATAGIDVVLKKKGPRDDSPEQEDTESAAPIVHILEIEIEYTHPGTPEPTKIGHAKLRLIDIWKAQEDGFFDCLDESSAELGKLALQFDDNGLLKTNGGCWHPDDFENEKYLVYLQELVVEPSWRGKGVGRSIFPLLFKLSQLNGAGFIFTFPSVLIELEPPRVNGDFGELTPEEEAAWSAKRERIIKFYRQASSGFRRIANSDFFCLAEDPNHASHSIPIDEDAVFEELPAPTTREEVKRRYMAYH
ncbi:hypothetical protein FB45DRAFT_884284 [Roridomyces roridus]|uniref:MYND-type domain-containing protein n=1 Tax=Roridomyces roridus TaxID=1738132 RepID=A0AAD7F7P0_9AGAR|nr:hypothetical protein FB45DRAFT_884284 [Roridomyces roridus]